MSLEETLQRLRDLAVRGEAARPRVDPVQRPHHDKRLQRLRATILKLETYDPEFDDEAPEELARQAGQFADRLEATLPAENAAETLTFTAFPAGETGVPRTVRWDGQRWLLRGGAEDRATSDRYALRPQLGEEAFRTNDLDVWRGARVPEDLADPGAVFRGLRAELDA
ncbi:hypothetical protein [Deinococcus budaensis]|uniref:Uncharacterized protein n=1 Tax=Deinococcus budaensis TaxID=1665626 RepID=A0A7W8LR75_9DEIO|nr:hypothetical protein [Deinococcus budaensis]MBB5235519.1 hypothetical protein [Deinococcus budaensis]